MSRGNAHQQPRQRAGCWRVPCWAWPVLAQLTASACAVSPRDDSETASMQRWLCEPIPPESVDMARLTAQELHEFSLSVAESLASNCQALADAGELTASETGQLPDAEQPVLPDAEQLVLVCSAAVAPLDALMASGVLIDIGEPDCSVPGADQACLRACSSDSEADSDCAQLCEARAGFQVHCADASVNVSGEPTSEATALSQQLSAIVRAFYAATVGVDAAARWIDVLASWWEQPDCDAAFDEFNAHADDISRLQTALVMSNALLERTRR